MPDSTKTGASSRAPTKKSAVDDQIAARLRAHGDRVTPQRVAILAALTPGEHLSAEEIWQRVAPAMSAVNRSTVYRTLERFRDLGLVTETDLGGGVRHFELAADQPHHHLVCQSCGAIVELDDRLIDPLRTAIATDHGFAVRIEHLALFGQCSWCQTQQASERE